MKAIVSILCAIFLAAPLAAQTLDCSEKANRAKCDAQLLTKQLALYRVPALETLANGGPLIRIFYTNAFGGRLGVISVERRPGAEPRIETRFNPEMEPRPDKDQLSSLLPLRVWTGLWDESRFFDRTLGPPPPLPNGMIRICGDGLGIMVEMIDELGRIRRATGSSCERDLAYTLAEKVATAALDADPACALLARLPAHNDIGALNDCRMLSGDRAAAAEAFNIMNRGAFHDPNGAEDAPAIRPFLDDDVELGWPGETPVQGVQAAARSWASHGRDGIFFPRLVLGEKADRVRVEGVIAFTPGEHERQPRTAKVTMIWERKNGYDFRLRSLVSEAPPPPPPDEH